jgi:hypothetical protein
LSHWQTMAPCSAMVTMCPPSNGMDQGDALFFLTVKHGELRWNPTTSEWFCVRCGRASDHLSKQDAQIELEQFECSLPAVDTVAHAGKEEGVAQLVFKGSSQEYRVAYRLEQIRDEPHLSPTPAIVTLLGVHSLEGSTIPDGEYLLHTRGGTLHAHNYWGQWTASWGPA